MRFLTKPVEIEAALFDGSLVGDAVQTGQSAEWKVTPLTCPQWFPTPTPTYDTEAEARAACAPGEVTAAEDDVFIGTLEGVMKADAGDWIIKGLRGEIYPCKPDVFHAKYQAL